MRAPPGPPRGRSGPRGPRQSRRRTGRGWRAPRTASGSRGHPLTPDLRGVAQQGAREVRPGAVRAHARVAVAVADGPVLGAARFGPQSGVLEALAGAQVREGRGVLRAATLGQEPARFEEFQRVRAAIQGEALPAEGAERHAAQAGVPVGQGELSAEAGGNWYRCHEESPSPRRLPRVWARLFVSGGFLRLPDALPGGIGVRDRHPAQPGVEVLVVDGVGAAASGLSCRKFAVRDGVADLVLGLPADLAGLGDGVGEFQRRVCLGG